jgi:uroporphyrinogen decarboxylase
MDGDEFLACIARTAEPSRVHPIEIFLDGEVEDSLVSRFGLDQGLDRADPFYRFRRQIALQRFLGYDYVLAGVGGLEFDFSWNSAADPGELGRKGGRGFANETKGPVTSWEEFEDYSWPDLSLADTRELEWYQKNLPDDMCLLGGLAGHILEELSLFMGYESFCISLYEDMELVKAILGKVVALHERYVSLLAGYDRVGAIWGTDDMGFKTGTLASPEHLRELVLPAHKRLASIAHEAGKLYLLHSCGKIEAIMEDLIEDVRIDAKHSFEDTIEDVADAKATYGSRIALLGGIDIDFLCRSDEAAVRARVRSTLERCAGAGYCLGTGNSVANYVPVDNYLAMLDEGRRWNRA